MQGNCQVPGPNLALTVLCVPQLLDNGSIRAAGRQGRRDSWKKAHFVPRRERARERERERESESEGENERENEREREGGRRERKRKTTVTTPPWVARRKKRSAFRLARLHARRRVTSTS